MTLLTTLPTSSASDLSRSCFQKPYIYTKPSLVPRGKVWCRCTKSKFLARTASLVTMNIITRSAVKYRQKCYDVILQRSDWKFLILRNRSKNLDLVHQTFPRVEGVVWVRDYTKPYLTLTTPIYEQIDQ